jgi:flagellar hook-basal body protein
MSFYTSLTGLNGATTDIATISNNIANVATTGYKRSRAEFGDIYATSPLQNASNAVGSGTILKSVKQQFTQGNISSSLNALDMAISGQGFFTLQPSLTSSQKVYSRNGSFSVNNDRYVVDSQGQYLQVFPVNNDGSVIATGLQSAQSLQLPTTSGLPKPTTAIELGLNLPADATVIPSSGAFTPTNPWRFDRTNPSTYNQSTSITIYDSLGNPTIATIYYVKTSNATETRPSNKWMTFVYIGEKEINPALISAKDEKSNTVFINKFGQITSDPQSLDPTFNSGAAHPLYKQDDQTQDKPSSPARAIGAFMQSSGFDFGDTDSNRVTVTSDPAAWADTREGGNGSANPSFWGRNMFSISVDGSEPQIISVRDGSYTGTELAAEMTGAANQAYGDDRYIKIRDTYVDSDGTVIRGNDVLKLNLFTLDSSGNSVGLKDGNGDDLPIALDLNGIMGESGTPAVGTGDNAAPAPENDIKLTRTQLVSLVQSKLNQALDERAADFGQQRGWVDASEPPIRVGYDVSSRSLTFTVDRTQLGPDASELASRFNSIKVFTDDAVTNDLGIPPGTISQESLVRAGNSWSGREVVPTGDPVVDPLDQRYGVSVTYNKDTRRFDFVSGTTGEASSMRIGRPPLATTSGDVQAQKTSFDVTNSDGGEQILSFGGPNFPRFKLVGSAYQQVDSTDTPILFDDLGQISSDGTPKSLQAYFARRDSTGATLDVDGNVTTNPALVDTITVTTLVTATTPPATKLIVTGYADGSQFQVSLREAGAIRTAEPVGASGSNSQKGIMFGDSLVKNSDATRVFSGTSDLLGVGDATNRDLVVVVAGRGLQAQPATATGNRAITPMNQTFVLQEALNENRMTFTVDGVVGSITLPIKAYTGETFAAEIQKRVNLIEDPLTGKTVSGVTVKYDPDGNRLIFTSGTRGEDSQINVVGHPNFGLTNVSQVRGSVPIITDLKQATDSAGNKLYVDKNGNISTQEPTSLQNWFPLYLNEGELTFDTLGKLISPKEGVIYSPFDPANGSNLLNLTVNYGKYSTQFAQPFSVLSLQQDGLASGRLDGLAIDASGTIRANYTNGETAALGKVILANFANPNGLKQIGNANYVATSGSGEAALGEAGADGFGTIQGGSLERSNVDITEELVSLITAQRNFQANAKAIETTTTLTQTIIQIRG